MRTRALLAGAVFVVVFFSGLHAEAAQIDAAGWRALIASFKQVKQEIEKGKPVPESVPVYYLSRFDEDPVTKEQLQEILELARKADRWRDFWFVVVHMNRRNTKSGELYSATVYFTPDREQGKVRRGLAIRVRSMMRNFRFDPQDPQLFRRFLYEYVQVGEESPQKFQPRGQNLPFPLPAGFSDQELQEIVDLVSSEDETKSILRVWRKGNAVEVEIGVREGGLSGSGETVECRKEDGRWVMRTVGQWVN